MVWHTKTKKKSNKTQAISVPKSAMDIVLPFGQFSQFEKVSVYLAGIIVVT